ncbi:MAG TPA: hypothetical protein VKX41_15200 [Alloacidobacterium sp.]|jgi:uncharacterized protein (DUF488 family)|nr:hypothetical protein [Alloacidobacterium sp.]
MKPRKFLLLMSKNETVCGCKKFLLETRGHYRVLEARDPDAMHTLLATQDVSLVLIDLDTNASHVAQNVKEFSASLPVVLFSSLLSSNEYDIGNADALLTRDSTTVELLECVAILTMRSEKMQQRCRMQHKQ